MTIYRLPIILSILVVVALGAGSADSAVDSKSCDGDAGADGTDPSDLYLLQTSLKLEAHDKKGASSAHEQKLEKKDVDGDVKLTQTTDDAETNKDEEASDKNEKKPEKKGEKADAEAKKAEGASDKNAKTHKKTDSEAKKAKGASDKAEKKHKKSDKKSDAEAKKGEGASDKKEGAQNDKAAAYTPVVKHVPPPPEPMGLPEGWVLWILGLCVLTVLLIILAWDKEPSKSADSYYQRYDSRSYPPRLDDDFRANFAVDRAVFQTGTSSPRAVAARRHQPPMIVTGQTPPGSPHGQAVPSTLPPTSMVSAHELSPRSARRTVVTGSQQIAVSSPRQAAQGTLVKHRGFISAEAKDLLQRRMTVEAAKRVAMELPGCAGFTFEGSDSGGPILIYFKDKFDVSDDGSDWTSYQIQKEAISPSAASAQLSQHQFSLNQVVSAPQFPEVVQVPQVLPNSPTSSQRVLLSSPSGPTTLPASFPALGFGSAANWEATT